MGKRKTHTSPERDRRRSRSRSRSRSPSRSPSSSPSRKDRHRHSKHKDDDRKRQRAKDEEKREHRHSTSHETTPVQPPPPPPPPAATEASNETDVEKAEKLAALKQQIAMKMNKLNQLKAQQQISTPVAAAAQTVVPIPTSASTVPVPLPSSSPSVVPLPSVSPFHIIPNSFATSGASATKKSIVINPNAFHKKAARPFALMLDEFGRQVDARGNVIVFDKSETATTLVNRRQIKDDLHHKTPKVEKVEEVVEDISAKSFCDPRMRVPSSSRKKRSALEFVKPGKFIRKAENMRHRVVMKELGLDAKLAAEVAEDEEGGGGVSALSSINPNTIELTTVKPKRDAPLVPAVEWWDQRILPKTSGDSYITAATPIPTSTTTSSAAPIPAVKTEPANADENATAMEVEEDTTIDAVENKPLISATTATTPVNEDDIVTDLLCGWNYQLPADSSRFMIRAGAITHYIHHPQPLEHPYKKKDSKPMPVMLTKQERKKLRRRNRAEAEKEKRDKIRMGLMDAPAPKLTLVNMMRVRGNAAIQDPTKVEAEVRKQMAARKMKHEDENESRKLTPEEQKQKRDKKLFGGDGKQLYAAVYRIDDLSDPQHQYKVDINAKQNKLTGITAIVPSFALVFVEGGAKPMARYRRLMERRVKWNERSTPREGAEPQPQHNSDDEGKQNTCSLVWEGPILKKAFQSFRIEKFDSVAMGRAFFDKKNVPQYFEMCKNHKTAQED